jgi:hypothetical protein
VQNRDGELQPLFDAQRQALGTRVGDFHKVETLQQLLKAAVDLARW